MLRFFIHNKDAQDMESVNKILRRKLESTDCKVRNTDKQGDAHLSFQPSLSKTSNSWDFWGEISDPWYSSLFSDRDEPVDKLENQRH